MSAVKVPIGWELVTHWPLNRSPMFKRIGMPGIMLIFRDKIDTWSLECQGHDGALATGTLDEVAQAAAHFDTAFNLRVAGLSGEEWAGDFYGRSLIAFAALADGEVELSREQIGTMEALLHELRRRLRDKEEKETYASRAERRSAEMKLLIHELYTWLLFGKQDVASSAVEAMEALLREMKREIVSERTVGKKQAS